MRFCCSAVTQLFYDYFALGMDAANWPPEMGEEATEVLVEELQHNGKVGMEEKRVLVLGENKGRVVNCVCW